MDNLVNAVLGSTVRHTMTVVAGILVSQAIIPEDMGSNFVVVASGVVLGGIGWGLSLLKAKKSAK